LLNYKNRYLENWETNLKIMEVCVRKRELRMHGVTLILNYKIQIFNIRKTEIWIIGMRITKTFEIRKPRT
jgi:hypothetical protein